MFGGRDDRLSAARHAKSSPVRQRRRDGDGGSDKIDGLAARILIGGGVNESASADRQDKVFG